MIETLLVVAVLYFVYRNFLLNQASRSDGSDDAAAVQITPLQNPVSSSNTKVYLPEDAVLKRHFITHLRGEIETSLSPRPTDSILLRHHETLIAAKLEQRLMGFETLKPC